MNQLFAPLWGRYIISIQSPIKWEDNEPEPNVAIYRPCDRRPPEHCELVIEVADITLHYDRTVKVPAYLSQGLEAWIVNCRKQRSKSTNPEKIDKMFDRSKHLELRLKLTDCSSDRARRRQLTPSFQ